MEDVEQLLGPSLELLTDEAIVDYSTDEQGNPRILTDDRDVNLKYRPFKPWKGGPYDLEMFGSPFVDQCLCGKTRRISDQPCPVCGAKVYSVEEGLRKFARIELPFYYLNDLRFELFKETFDDIFKDSEIKLDFANPDLRVGGYSNSRGSRKLGIKVFDMCQFDYNPKQKVLTISEFITDKDKCSYEGLIKIIKENFPDRLDNFLKIVNRMYIVLPAMIRPFTVEIKNGKKLLGSHPMSIFYGMIIRLCCNEDPAANKLRYDDVMRELKTPAKQVRYTALLRALINAGKKEATDLLNSSKENLSRILYSVRTNNSLRSPIVPSTTLPIDTVGLPIHLCYEMMRTGFTKYLQEKLNFTKEEANRSVKLEYDNPKIQELFKEYAENQMVIYKLDHTPKMLPQ